MKRRAFITLLGGTAAWPFIARAQQPALPVIGFLGSGTPEGYAKSLGAFRIGLGEAGYVEGRNVGIDFRWADGQYDRLPALAAELVSRRVSVIAAGALPAALTAKSATSTIPIVFMMGSDSVKFGLVASLNRPGGNVTGVGLLSNALLVKQLEFLREVVPAAVVFAFLVNPDNPNAENDTKEAQAAAGALGIQLLALSVRSESELDAAFVTMLQKRVGGLLVGPDPFFTTRTDKLAALTTRFRTAAIHYLREFTAAGGLASYDTGFTDGYRQGGAYVGRILKGEKPGDLPVQQSTKVELVINLKTAKSLGLQIPTTLLVRADEVIE
jgi:putative ABC transport system substrate-binding protein